MAVSSTVNTGRRTSFSDRSQVKPNIDERLDYIPVLETPFLNMLGFMSSAEGGATAGSNTLSFPCTQQRHQWDNDVLIPSTSAVGTAYVAANGALVVTTGEGVRFDAGDILRIAGTTPTYLSVTSVSTDTLTVVELDSTGAAHPVGDVVYNMGNAELEGAAASLITARHTEFGTDENFTQIFLDKVDVSGTEMATDRYHINGSPLDFQLNKVLTQLAIKLERAALYSIRNGTYPSTNATARRMGGLAYWLRDNSSALVTDAGGADLDEVILNTVFESVWNQGTTPSVLMLPYRQKQFINAFIQPLVRVQRTESVAGVLVGEYVSDMGSVMIMLNRYLHPSDAVLLSPEYIGIGPLTGNGQSRAFFKEELPKDGDYERTMILGEYTMEVRNATKAHAWIKNLST